MNLPDYFTDLNELLKQKGKSHFGKLFSGATHEP